MVCGGYSDKGSVIQCLTNAMTSESSKSMYNDGCAAGKENETRHASKNSQDSQAGTITRRKRNAGRHY